MMFRLSNVVCWLVLLTFLAGPGCRQLLKRKQKPTPTPANPLADPNFVAPDYASRAIDAAGGRRAWANTKKIQFDCVVTLYRPDGSSHITAQNHEIYPWRSFIRMSAREPGRPLGWEFSGPDAVRSSRAATYITAWPFMPPLSDQQFAAAIFNIVTAPVRLLDQPAGIADSPRPVRIEGRWYNQIQINGFDKTESAGTTVFYQDPVSSMIEMLRLPHVCNGRFLVIRGYDYRRQFGEDVVSVPTKIEILQTDTEGSRRRRLATLDCHNFKFLP
jgi:hypothetical protein